VPAGRAGARPDRHARPASVLCRPATHCRGRGCVDELRLGVAQQADELRRWWRHGDGGVAEGQAHDVANTLRETMLLKSWAADRPPLCGETLSEGVSVRLLVSQWDQVVRAQDQQHLRETASVRRRTNS
jgi:hypothetical protein